MFPRQVYFHFSRRFRIQYVEFLKCPPPISLTGASFQHNSLSFSGTDSLADCKINSLVYGKLLGINSFADCKLSGINSLAECKLP